MKKEYGRISLYLVALVVFASCANAQAGANAQADANLQAGANAQAEKVATKEATFKLPEGIEDILKIEDGPILVQSETRGATIGAPDYEPIESLVSVEAQMILLAKTKSGARVFVPRHLSPNFFARLFGGVIIPTRDIVAPSSE